MNKTASGRRYRSNSPRFGTEKKSVALGWKVLGRGLNL